MSKKRVFMQCLIDEDLKAKFKIWCIENKTTATEVIINYIKSLVEENEK